MKKTQETRIMFLHGLESKVPSEKTKWMDETFKLFAPQINYREKNIYNTVLNLSKKFKPSIIIGSSMGGFFSYYIAAELNIPALLFNPALPYRTDLNPIVENINISLNKLHLVLGKNDNIIKTKDTLAWINNNKNNIDDITIRILNFEHRIPIEIFTNEVDLFYKQLLYK